MHPSTVQQQDAPTPPAHCYRPFLLGFLASTILFILGGVYLIKTFRLGHLAKQLEAFPDVTPEGHFITAVQPTSAPALLPAAFWESTLKEDMAVESVAPSPSPSPSSSPTPTPTPSPTPTASASSGAPAPPLSPPSPTPAPRSVLLYTEDYGSDSNNRIQMAEALALSVLLGRDFYAPKTNTLSSKLHDWEAIGLGLGIKVHAPGTPLPGFCANAPVLRIQGVFGEPRLDMKAAPHGFQMGGQVDLNSLVAWGEFDPVTGLGVGETGGEEKGNGGVFVDDEGVQHTPPSTHPSKVQSWWPFHLFFSPQWAAVNVGRVPFPNLATLLASPTYNASTHPCLVLDNAFFRVDWRRYPALFRRVWGALAPKAAFGDAAREFHATSPLAGAPYIGIHLRQTDMCGGGKCKGLGEEVSRLALAASAAPQCGGAKALFVFTDAQPGSPAELALKELFPVVVLGPRDPHDPWEYKGLWANVFEQEMVRRWLRSCASVFFSRTFCGALTLITSPPRPILYFFVSLPPPPPPSPFLQGARANCFIGNPNSTFTGMTRVRRQVGLGKSKDTEFLITHSRRQ